MAQAVDNKEISVIFKLDNLDILNGGFEDFETDKEFDENFRSYLLKQFGQSAESIKVARNREKVKLTWHLPNYVQDAQNHHQQAVSQSKNKQYVDAINNWVKAISMNPGDPDFYFYLGIAFFEIRNYKEAIENLRKAIDICPIFFKAYLILGTVYLKTRKFEEAEYYLKTSIVFQSHHALAYLNLGAVYSILKRYDEGIQMFEKTLELSPGEVRAHFGLAKIYSFRGEAEKANHYFQQVITIDAIRQLTNLAKRTMLAMPITAEEQDENGRQPVENHNIEQLYSQGYNAYLHLDYDRAVDMYSAYVKNKPNDDFVWFALGEAYIRNGSTLKAIESFQRAVVINPNKAVYLKELALSFSYLNKAKEVGEYASKALKLGKADSVTLTLLGDSLVTLKQATKAVEHLNHAITLNSNNLYATFCLAKAYMALGRHSEAINCLQMVIKSSLNTPLKMQAESLLSNAPVA